MKAKSKSVSTYNCPCGVKVKNGKKVIHNLTAQHKSYIRKNKKSSSESESSSESSESESSSSDESSEEPESPKAERSYKIGRDSDELSEESEKVKRMGKAKKKKQSSELDSEVELSPDEEEDDFTSEEEFDSDDEIDLQAIEAGLKGLVDENYKDSTIKLYLNQTMRIVKGIFQGNITLDMFSKVEEVLDFLEKFETTPPQRKNILQAWLSCAKGLGVDKKTIDLYSKDLARLRREDSEYRTYRPANEKELENEITMDELIELRDSAKEKMIPNIFTTADLAYIILCWYTMLPPLRSSELCSIRVFNNKEELKKIKHYVNNYLCLDTGKITVGDHKTIKGLGIKNIDMPDDLLEAQREYIKKTGSKFIFETMTRRIFTNSNLHYFLSRLIGKNISSQMLRKIYISEKVIDGNMSADERKKAAAIMGHSIAIQTLQYSALSKELHPREEVNEDNKELKNEIKDNVQKELSSPPPKESKGKELAIGNPHGEKVFFGLKKK